MALLSSVLARPCSSSTKSCIAVLGRLKTYGRFKKMNISALFSFMEVVALVYSFNCMLEPLSVLFHL